MVVKTTHWLAASLFGGILALSPILIAAEKSDMMKDEKAGMMKDEKSKMTKDQKGSMKEEGAMMKDAKGMKDNTKETKGMTSGDKMKSGKMEEKK